MGHGAALAILCAILLSFGTVRGQQAPTSRLTARLGLGIGLASSSADGENLFAAGPVGSALVGFAIGPSDLALEINGQLFEAAPPIGDQTYTAFYFLAGPSIYRGSARRSYIRPSLGIAHRSWSGEEVVTDTKTTLAVGVAIGSLAPIGNRFRLGPELYVRYSRVDEISTALIGLQLLLQPVGQVGR